MVAQLQLILGRAGTGKTAHLLDRYRTALADSREKRQFGRTLWLAPTRKACRALECRLLSGDAVAIGRPQVMTFDDFAEKILFQAALRRPDERILPISNLERRWIVRQLLDRLLADGRLPYFAAVAKTTGFLDLTIDFIVELKREELWPEKFAEIVQQRDGRPADRELASIYSEYQRLLNRCQRYDAEGRFWRARELVTEGVWEPFSQLDLVVADGFTDFTRPQHEILAAMVKHAGQTVISLPFDPADARRDLFAKPETTYRTLCDLKTRGVTVSEQTLKPAVGREPPVLSDILSQKLFANTRTLQQAESTAGLDIVETIGPQSQLRLVAERVKTLLRRGVPPKDIVVAYRSLGDDAEMLHEMFEAAEIPCDCELDATSERHPLLRTLIAVLQLELDDWQFERLTFLVGAGHFRPAWRNWDAAKSPRIIARQLRRRKLSSEREAILHGLEYAARKTDPPDDDVVLASEWLHRLSDLLAPLRSPATLAGWIDRVVTLVGELGLAKIDRHPPDETTAALQRDDAATWEYIKRILYDLARYEEVVDAMFDEPGRRKKSTAQKLPLADVAMSLMDLFRSTPLLTTKPQTPGVRIVSAATARHLDVPYLFLPGMNEGSWPQQRRENCLYGEQDRAQLRDLGVPFSVLQMHRFDEMNLFYSVVTRARQQLVISYAAVDAAGQPLYASPYVNALKSLFSAETLHVAHYGRLDPLPEHNQVLTAADLRIRAVADVYEKNGELFRSLLQQPRSEAVARNIVAAAEMAARRASVDVFSDHEGVLTQPASLEYLRQRYPLDREYSATELEQYATCPFKFFLQSVLQVEALESPEPETDHRRRGIVVHSILSTLLREAQNEQQPPAEWEPAAIAARFHDLVTQQLGGRVAESKLHDSLNRVEQKLLDEWGSLYGAQWHEYIGAFGNLWDAPPTAEAFEVAFGTVPDENADDAKAATAYPSLKIGKGENALSLRGRIDRIDVGVTGETPVYNVIDYKTGMPPRFSKEDIHSGRALQLLLYALAVQRLGIAGPDALPYQILYWSIKNKGFTLGMKGVGQRLKCKQIDAAAWKALVELLEERLPQLVRLLQAGQFPVHNTDENCTGFCDYSTVCRVHQVRSLAKVWHPVSAAANLNGGGEGATL